MELADYDNKLETKLKRVYDFLVKIDPEKLESPDHFEDTRSLKLYINKHSELSQTELIKILKRLDLDVDFGRDEDQNIPLCFYKYNFGKTNYTQLVKLANDALERFNEIQSRNKEIKSRNSELDKETASPFLSKTAFRTRTAKKDLLELKSQREGSKITPEAIEKLKEELVANRQR